VVPADGEADPSGAGSVARTGVSEATARLPWQQTSWYTGATHDLIRTRAARVTGDLLQLSADAEQAA